MQGKHRGFHLGPYLILRPLGQGRRSRVFLAQHEMLGHQCAIKVLASRYQKDPDFLNRLRLEAWAIAKLAHPNIVRGYDFNEDARYGKTITFLAMEYVVGRDLQRMVEEDGPMGYEKAADLVSQAADGLACAHQAGIIHRNIEPTNLMVGLGGVLKILGFAPAGFITEPWQTPDEAPPPVGTADYVASEQVADSSHVDGRADIYSLGYTFYFLLTGRRPFPRATVMEVLTAHGVEEPEPISRFRPDVPSELIDIFRRMTAKAPAERYATAVEAAVKLRSWLRDLHE